MDDDDWGSIYYGFGTVHDLRDEGEPEPPLSGCRSVSPAAARLLAPKRPQPQRHPIGFYTGRPKA